MNTIHCELNIGLASRENSSTSEMYPEEHFIPMDSLWALIAAKVAICWAIAVCSEGCSVLVGVAGVLNWVKTGEAETVLKDVAAVDTEWEMPPNPQLPRHKTKRKHINIIGKYRFIVFNSRRLTMSQSVNLLSHSLSRVYR